MALATIPAPSRAAIIACAATGENVSVLRSADEEPKPSYSKSLRTFNAFRSGVAALERGPGQASGADHESANA
jgi:hypothetical protein